MDIGFDHTTWPSRRGDAAPASFDWHGLRARFLAAQACRTELSPGAADGLALGSFDAAAAETLAGYEHETRGINPTGLADGKAIRPDDETTPGQAGPTFEGNDD